VKRFILTGAPVCGKTSIIRQLELDGFNVVEEAATDVIALQQERGIAEPWTNPLFIDVVASLQRERHTLNLQLRLCTAILHGLACSRTAPTGS
jgi:predicted ATPase